MGTCELINCHLMFNDLQLCSINTGFGAVSPHPPTTFSVPRSNPAAYALPFLPLFLNSLISGKVTLILNYWKFRVELELAGREM